MRDCGGTGVPAHRVIASGGRLGGYGGSEHLKRSLLVAEGVTFRGRRVAIEECAWRAARGARRA
jgi:methylated-DNA-[protein]-cysteine S-methyltransferase